MITVFIFTLLFVAMIFLANRWMIKFWYQFQLRRYARKARMAKAIWLSTKESMQKREGGRSPWAVAEGNYCDALVKMRTYEKLVSPMVPVPTKDD